VAGGSTAITAKKKKKTPSGTKLHFRLSEAAVVTLSFARETVGLKTTVKRRTTCKATHKRVKRSKRCTLLVAAGSLTRTSKAGTDSVAFTGRVGSRALPRGSYRLSARAVDGAGNRSKTATATFTVVAAHH
jgi:predicted phage tail protein